jgi:hypothetical protein
MSVHVVATRRFISSGSGLIRLPLRMPASTCAPRAPRTRRPMKMTYGVVKASPRTITRPGLPSSVSALRSLARCVQAVFTMVVLGGLDVAGLVTRHEPQIGLRQTEVFENVGDLVHGVGAESELRLGPARRQRVVNGCDLDELSGGVNDERDHGGTLNHGTRGTAGYCQV